MYQKVAYAKHYGRKSLNGLESLLASESERLGAEAEDQSGRICKLVGEWGISLPTLIHFSGSLDRLVEETVRIVCCQRFNLRPQTMSLYPLSELDPRWRIKNQPWYSQRSILEYF